MARTVYIFGAGASRACSSRTPTIRELFSKAKEVGGRSNELREELSEHLRKRFGIDPEDLLKGDPDFERVFTLVASDRDMSKLVGSIEEQSLIATAEISLESLVYELLMTVTWDEVTGSGDLYDQLLKKVAEGDVLVSFNYDLQLDAALERTGRWSPLDGYGLNFHRYQDSEGKQLDPNPTIRSTLHLLKLHGSLNWFRMTGIYGHPTGIGWKSEFSGEHKGRDVLVSIRSRSTVSAIGILNIDCVEESNHFHLDVNIIPPVLHKELSAQFGALWYRALDSVAGAERVVIIGYSLPPTDFGAEWLFRKAASLVHRENVALEVANPDSAIPRRFARVLGPKFKLHKTYVGFLELVEQS